MTVSRSDNNGSPRAARAPSAGSHLDLFTTPLVSTSRGRGTGKRKTRRWRQGEYQAFLSDQVARRIPLACALCGCDLMPDGPLPACSETASGWHVSNVSRRHLSDRELDARIAWMPKTKSSRRPT